MAGEPIKQEDTEEIDSLVRKIAILDEIQVATERVLRSVWQKQLRDKVENGRAGRWW